MARHPAGAGLMGVLLVMLLALFDARAARASGGAPPQAGGGPELPDLRVLAIERVSVAGEIPGLSSAPDTPIRLRVIVANDSPFDLVARRPDEPPVEIGIVSGGVKPQTTRMPLPGRKRSEQPASAAFYFILDLPCGRATEVTAEVDRPDVVRERIETNNRLTVKVPGNRCRSIT